MLISMSTKFKELKSTKNFSRSSLSPFTWKTGQAREEVNKALRKNICHICLSLSFRGSVKDKAGIQTTWDQPIEKIEARFSWEGPEKSLGGKLQISRFKVWTKQQLCRENSQVRGLAWEKWQSGGRQHLRAMFPC